MDVLPISAVMNVPIEAAASETASRLGVRFVVHGAIQMAKGVWRLSMEMYDTHLQSACFTRKRDLEIERLPDLEDEIAKQVAVALNRPLGSSATQIRPRYSKDPM